MNISTDPWIPVVWSDGRPGVVNLCEAFQKGRDIADLALRPHERVAVMRLLVCVAQAALNGPRDRLEYQSAPARLSSAASSYLQQWSKAFELLGEGQRFLQVPALRSSPARSSDGEGSPISKLDLTLASGNNSTLFDNAGGAERRLEMNQAVLMLLTFQCFSPGGRIGTAVWGGAPTSGNGSSEHAPCVAGNLLHAVVRRENLLDTVCCNLMTKEQAARFFGSDVWGKPVWEQMPSGSDDAAAVANATSTYLGRLLPLSRAIRLEDDGQSAIIANGLKFPTFPEWREPTSTAVIRRVKDVPERRVLRASVQKAAWRELHSIAVLTADHNSNGGPAALERVVGGSAFDLWVGGLVTSQAKLVDAVESVLHVPAEMLQETGQRIYEEGVRWAERRASHLTRAITAYHSALGDKIDRPELKDRRFQVWGRATGQYWTDVEQNVASLLQAAINPGEVGLTRDWYATEWGRSTSRAACSAYSNACPHSTPQQMRAFALGMNALHGKAVRDTSEQPENDQEVAA